MMYVEAHIFSFVRTLEILHVGTSQAERAQRRFSTTERTWVRRMQAKTGKQRVRAAYEDAMMQENDDRWNDWEMIVALEGIRDNIRPKMDRPVYMMRLMRDLGMTEHQGPSRAEAEDALATLWRLIWYFRMYKVCEGSGETFPIWMRTEKATLYTRLTTGLEDRLRRETRRSIGKEDVVASLCPNGRYPDRSLNEVYCLQVLRQWSWRVVQAAVLGNVIRYRMHRDSGARGGLDVRGSTPEQDAGLTDAALVDLLRTLLDEIRENRANVDGQKVRLYKSLEHTLTQTIDSFVDAVVFGTDAYVDAIFRIQ